jgi:hypothetical protein
MSVQQDPATVLPFPIGKMPEEFRGRNPTYFICQSHARIFVTESMYLAIKSSVKILLVILSAQE